MKRFFSMLLFVFAASLSLSPINLSYEIEWCRQRNISWEDFWGKPDSSSRYSAISATYIQEKHKCDYRNRFTFSVRSVFLKTQSWSTDKKSAKLLHHEQLHFDLTEVYARKLRKVFSELDNPCQMSKTQVKSIIDNLYDEMEKAHNLYDHETVHGLRTNRQEFWTKIIGEALFELDSFACTD